MFALMRDANLAPGRVARADVSGDPARCQSPRSNHRLLSPAIDFAFPDRIDAGERLGEGHGKDCPSSRRSLFTAIC
jgi:hypothetical protein